MADTGKSPETVEESMGKKEENEAKSVNQNDEDSESTEEQPLDIGEHYLVQRSAEVWRKFVPHNQTNILK